MLLELGGNNAAIVTPSADLDLAVRGIVFSAAGTAGQRCTTLRRLIAHRSVADDLVERIATAYRSLPVGDPSADGTLVGPADPRDGPTATWWVRSSRRARTVVRCSAVTAGMSATGVLLRRAGNRADARADRDRARRDVRPHPLRAHLRTLDEAIALNNDVPQGLSSAIFTTDIREAERFMAADGSDCGIANVNIGTSGAEIGGAFGGEKETGGGRESGSDSWKAYMRRATNTVNYSSELPLAQGVQFG